MIYRTLQVPALWMALATGTKQETCRFGFLIYRTLQVPAKGAAQAAPLTPHGSSFSCWKKREQKTIQGDYCPLENPLLGSALAASPDPTAGILCGNSRRIESQQVRSFTGKFCTLIRLSQNRETARQADSPVSSANSLESSKCNLVPFRADRAGK